MNQVVGIRNVFQRKNRLNEDAIKVSVRQEEIAERRGRVQAPILRGPNKTISIDDFPW